MLSNLSNDYDMQALAQPAVMEPKLTDKPLSNYSHQVRTCKQCGETKPINHFRAYYPRSKVSGDGGASVSTKVGRPGIGKPSRYRLCLACEKVNSRYKYLSKQRGELLEKQAAMLQEPATFPVEELQSFDSRFNSVNTEWMAIEELYAAQRACGLQPPSPKPKQPIAAAPPKSFIEEVQALTRRYNLQADSLKFLLLESEYKDEFLEPSLEDGDTPSGASPQSLAPAPPELIYWMSRDIASLVESSYKPDYLYEVYDTLDAKYRPVTSVSSSHIPIHDNRYKPHLRCIYNLFCQYEDLYYATPDE